MRGEFIADDAWKGDRGGQTEPRVAYVDCEYSFSALKSPPQTITRVMEQRIMLGWFFQQHQHGISTSPS